MILEFSWWESLYLWTYIINSYRPYTILYLITAKFCFSEGLLPLLVYNLLEGQNCVSNIHLGTLHIADAQ